MKSVNLTIHDTVMAVMAKKYSRGESDGAKVHESIQSAFEQWAIADSANASDAQISKTLRQFTKYLTSKHSPYSEAQQSEAEFSKLVNAIKPGGLLHTDMQTDKFDASSRKRLMKRFASFMKQVAQTTQSGDNMRAMTALAQFPPQMQDEYQCAPGTFSRMFAAERQLESPALTTLTAGYGEATQKLVINLSSRIYKGNQVHIDPAINYLMGVPKDIVEAVDTFYRTPLDEISANEVFDTYKTTLSLGGEIRSSVDVQVKVAVGNESPEKVMLFSVENQKTFFTPWSIDLESAQEGFYDDTFEIQRAQVSDPSADTGVRAETDAEFNERLQGHLTQKVYDKLNEEAFGSDEGLFIQWHELSAEADTNIPTVKALTSGEGVGWITDQVRSVVSNGYVIETVEQKAALHSLFLFSEDLWTLSQLW